MTLLTWIDRELDVRENPPAHVFQLEEMPPVRAELLLREDACPFLIGFVRDDLS